MKYEDADTAVVVTVLCIAGLYVACWIAYRVHESIEHARAAYREALAPIGAPYVPSVPVGAAPGTYKAHSLLITQCPDPLMWYAKLVGQEVPYLGTWGHESVHKSREPDGFINIVKMADARIIVREERRK